MSEHISTVTTDTHPHHTESRRIATSSSDIFLSASVSEDLAPAKRHLTDTMSTLDLSIEELLESTQRDATEAKAKQHSEHTDQQRNGAGPGTGAGPRGGRGGRGDYKYEQNGRDSSPTRSRKTNGNRDDDAKDDNDNTSANGSVRSSRRGDDHYRSSRRPSSRDRHDSYRSSGGDYYRAADRPRSRSPSDEDRYYRPSGNRRGDDRRDDRRGGRDDRRDDNRSRRELNTRGPYTHTDTMRGPRGRRSPRVKTPEPTDDERDSRTVFVQQLAARLRTRELEAFFSKIGPVKEAQIVKDRVSGRSKG